MPVGTAAAIALGLGSIGGSTAANIYGTRSTNRTNQRALDASERSDTRAAELAAVEGERQERLERERLAEERRAREAQLEDAKAARELQIAEARADREAKLQRDRERWADYTRIYEPYWRAGSGIINTLAGLAGYQGGMPSYQGAPTMPPSGPRPTGDGIPVLGGPSREPISQVPNTRVPSSAHAWEEPARRGAGWGISRPSMITPPQAPSPLNLSDLMMWAQIAGNGTPGPSPLRNPTYSAVNI